MLKLLAGLGTLAWGAAVAAYGLAGDPVVRPGADAAGLVISLVMAVALVAGGGRVAVDGLRARRGR